MSESQTLATVNGVEITSEMVSLYAQRFAEENVESNQAGFVQAIASWIEGKGVLDSFLTDSPETRDVFAGVRKAHFAANGKNSDEIEFSKVTFAEGVEKGEAEKALIAKTQEDHAAEGSTSEEKSAE